MGASSCEMEDDLFKDRVGSLRARNRATMNKGMFCLHLPL